MAHLYFEKIASTDRIAEPAFVSLPVTRGAVTDPESLRLLAAGLPLPRQVRCLSRWPDHSVKWLLASFQPDLAGDKATVINYDFSGGPPPLPVCKIVIDDQADGWHVDTGPLTIRIGKDPFVLFSHVRLEGRELIGPEGLNGGFFYRQEKDSSIHNMAEGRVESATWIERGPLRAKLVVKGWHSGNDPLGYRVAMEFYAGKPWVRLQYQALAVGPEDSVTLAYWGLGLKPAGRADRCEAAMGHYKCGSAPGSPGEPKSIEIDGNTAKYTGYESVPESYCTNFWADWNDSRYGGIGVSVFQAMQNFPKALRSSSESLEIDLLPAGQPPLTLRRGVAKTHTMQLHFHRPDEPLIEINRRSFLFQLPDLPRLPAEVYSRAGVFTERLPGRRFDAFDHWLHQRAQNVPRAFGMLHWGDHVDAKYTAQGRGLGSSVWRNGEYDEPHVYYLLFILLGERWLRDFAVAAGRHWMDVDVCHDSDDPLRHGGLIAHSVEHVSGKVTISHQWLAGLLDIWHLNGDEEALETAVSIGHNILRHLQQDPVFQEGASLASCRAMGWALRALGPLWQETGEVRFRDECERIVNVFKERLQDYGGIVDTYTEHNLGRVPFMISLTVESLRQWSEISQDETIGKLIIRQADDLLQNAVGVGGFMFYKELPSLHRYQPMLQTIMPFVEAYRLTGEKRFLKPAYRVVEASMRTAQAASPRVKTLEGDALLISGSGWAAFDIQPLLAFYAVLAEVNDSRGEPLLKPLDFRNDF